MLAGHRRFHDGLLQGPAVLARGLRAKAGEAEPAVQLLVRVVPFAAPRAALIAAGRLPQPPHECARFGELVPDPRRQDRVATGHREPGEGVGQGPAGGAWRRHLERLAPAGDAGQPGPNRRTGLGVGRPGRVADGGEGPVEPGAVRRSRCQPVPGRQQIGIDGLERGHLLTEHPQGEAGVQLGIVHPGRA